jgi:hypothetical protein
LEPTFADDNQPDRVAPDMETPHYLHQRRQPLADPTAPDNQQCVLPGA